MKLAYEEHGSGIPLVLLHAFPLDRKMWLSQSKNLIESNFRIILPDLRGFGESHSFSDINLIEDMAKDIAELLDFMKIEQAIIGGLSMGGYVLFNFYRLFPERCAALIFCDTNFAADTSEKREARFDLIEKIEINGNKALIENMLPQLISDFTKRNKEKLIAELERRFSEVNPQAAIAALRGMAERTDHEQILSRINVPTLLIYGESDAVTKPEIGKYMNEKIPGSQFVILKNAGHYSNLEQPKSFSAAMVDFVTNLTLK